MRDSNNKELSTKHFDTRARFGGAPSVLLKRAKLQQELMRFATSAEFAGTPAEVIQGAKVTRVDALAGKVWTKDGRVFEGDLIVGADGIYSIVRSAVLGGQDTCISSTIRSYDTMTFMTQLSIDDLQSDPNFAYLSSPTSQAGLCSIQSGPGVKNKRILTYHTSPHSLQVVGYTSENEFAGEFESAKTAIIRDIPVSRVVEDFATHFTDSVVNLFRHNKIDAWRIRDVAPLDSWFSGKALLIGDAAHAVSPHAGQGCNITIEDAEALGFLLRDVESSEGLPVALQMFMSLRKARVDFITRRSRELGDIRTDEDKTKEPITPEKFAREVYTYQGAEQALRAPKPPASGISQ